MELIILLLIFLTLGFLLGSSRFSRKADQTTEKTVAKSKRFADKIEDSWTRNFRPTKYSEQFRSWVNGAGKDLFPVDFISWLNGLSNSDLREFSKSLTNYSNSLGFDLSQLIQGDLDNDPRLRQIFVEAITVYSSAYRKAKQARESHSIEGSDSDQKKSSGDPEVSGKVKGETQNRGTKELVEVPSTD